MATEYIVCRTARVVLSFMAGMPLNRADMMKSSWDAPILSDDSSNHARIFSNRKDAEAYCRKMNYLLLQPHVKDGQHYIDLAPYEEYVVIPIAKGTAADANVKKK